MGKTALLQKTLAFGSRDRIDWCLIELAAQHVTCTRIFTVGQFLPDLSQGLAADAMAFQFGKNTVIAVTPGASMHQRFGKTFLGKKFGRLQPIEQSLDIVVFLRVSGKLTRKFQTTMLT